MLSQITRAARARSIVSAVRLPAVRQTRGFITPTVARKADFVQDLYLKELKAYKVPPVKESDAEGQVSTFTMPKVPQSPEETDLASSLKEYETMAVEVEGMDASAAASGVEPVVEDWLVEEEEEAPAAH